MKISACMIGKNEEKLLPKALRSIKWMDEIIFVDTGSNDRTVEIAGSYTCKLFHFPWIDDFSAARNFSMSKATGDWIFIIDCDWELATPEDWFRHQVKLADYAGVTSAFCNIGKTHQIALLFKNHSGIKYVGKCHECPNVITTFKADINIKPGHSENHAKDPGRNLRILLSDERTTRNKFYLGRTMWEMGKWEEAINMLKSYLMEATWLAEIADAYYVIACCYWQLQKGDKARTACLKSIEINANFKKAHLLMSDMSWNHNAVRWRQFADIANNSGVLFA